MGTYMVPFLFVLRPALLLFGADLQQIAIASISAFMGIAALSIGISRYLLAPLSLVESGVLIIGGALFCTPILKVNMIGLVLVVIVVLKHVWVWRRLVEAKAAI